LISTPSRSGRHVSRPPRRLGALGILLTVAVGCGCHPAESQRDTPSRAGRQLAEGVLLTCRVTGGDPHVDETLTVKQDGSLHLRAAGAKAGVDARILPGKLRGLRKLLDSPEVAALEADYTERMSPEARPAELTITTAVGTDGSRTVKTKAFGDHPPALDALIREVAPLMRRAQHARQDSADGGA